MTKLEQAKTLLDKENYTCVIINGETVYHSEKRGIAPILNKLEEDPVFLQGASVADKVIGKSAAMLLIKAEIKELYANIISEYAWNILKTSNIEVTYDKKVSYIKNRQGTGMCPMENSVIDIQDCEEAYSVLKEKVKSLAQTK